MLFKGLSICSSGGHFIQKSGTILAIFGRRSPEQYFCEILLKSGYWPRCCLKVFLFLALAAILFSRTILAILVECHPRNISVKLFWNWATGLGGDVG